MGMKEVEYDPIRTLRVQLAYDLNSDALLFERTGEFCCILLPVYQFSGRISN
jgi:hypothetical protein